MKAMSSRSSRLRAVLGSLVLAGAYGLAPQIAVAQTGWDTGIDGPSIGAPPPAAPTPAPNMTVVPRTGGEVAPEGGDPIPIQLEAQLTADGQRIEQGVTWRVFQDASGTDGKLKLLSTHRDASVSVRLKPGDYTINAAYGKANLTRRITVAPGPQPMVERFVLNAGGLRVEAKSTGGDLPASLASYSVYSDRDQSDARALVLARAKPGVIIRLNAGIYHIVSTFGDANATVHSDVTVEAGKLTEVSIAHAAAKASFKLVQRAGGEALPDTQWVIQTPQGQEIKESVGALPMHILAPGTYTVLAKSQGKVYQRDFTLENGETTQVEVIMK